MKNFKKNGTTNNLNGKKMLFSTIYPTLSRYINSIEAIKRPRNLVSIKIPPKIVKQNSK